MKKQLSRALLGLVAVLMLTGAAFAQTAGTIRIHVPFDFVAGQKQLPAGSYTIRRMSAGAGSTLLIQGEKERDAAVILTNAGEQNTSKAWVAFRQHGDNYFLAEVSMPGTPAVREVPTTSDERRLVEEANSGAKPKRITIIGSMR